MELPERSLPVPMRRVAVVALSGSLRDVLVALADTGVVDLAGPLGAGGGPALEALRRLERGAGARPPAAPELARSAPDVSQLERRGDRATLAGEVELERRREAAVEHGGFSLLVGWAPEPALASLRTRLAELGASLVELAAPAGAQAPTLLAPAPAAQPFRPLIDTYGAVPYRDVDPTMFAAASYCLMFGMMFGDVGDGALVVFAALLLRRARAARVRALRRVWPMIAACGGAAIVFGLLYGEMFGPTGIVPAVWLSPLDSPTRLLVAAIALGGALLFISCLIGTLNRFREGGVRRAVTAASGLPGLLLLIAGGLIAAGVAAEAATLRTLGFVLGGVATAALGLGLALDAGRGAVAASETLIGMLDALMRTFANVFSFSRLAAFGLMHAAIGKVVLDAARGLAVSPAGVLAAIAVFVVGGSLALALEALVAAVQALRLEYYELFSRVFAGEGRPFRPWRLPLISTEEAG